jgi:hypothetical protein
MEGQGIHDMKPAAYRIGISDNSVSVQHRVPRPSWEVWLLIPSYALIIYFNHGFKVLAELLRAGEWANCCALVLLMFLFILLFTWSWLVYSSGEFLHCDAMELQLGKRRVWTRWRRKTFTKSSISQISYARRGGSKTRSYSVLTFKLNDKRMDILEDISLEDAASVLRACQSLGFRCILPEIFLNHAGPMNEDIGKRGWFVNPWRPDTDKNHPIRR